MKAATKEAPVKPKSAKNSKKPSFSPEDVENAIRNAFPAVKGSLSVRYLWTNGSVHRYRVNWWGDSGICVSKFLHVTEQKGKIKVEKK